MNYRINIEKLVAILEDAEKSLQSLPDDILSLVQEEEIPQNSGNYEEDAVLRKMFNGLLHIAVQMAYTLHRDNGVRRMNEFREGIRSEIRTGGLPSAFGIINYSILVLREWAYGSFVAHTYGVADKKMPLIEE